MAKTYTAVPSVTAGDVYTAANFNTYTATNVSNLIVPPACQVVRTTNLTSYTSSTDISWTTTASFDTDGMFSSGAPTRITIQTTGLYVVSFIGGVTCTATLTQINPFIYINGLRNLNYTAYPVTGTTNAFWSYSFIHSFTAADYITARVGMIGGSNYTLYGSSTTEDVQTRCSVTWIGRTS